MHKFFGNQFIVLFCGALLFNISAGCNQCNNGFDPNYQIRELDSSSGYILSWDTPPGYKVIDIETYNNNSICIVGSNYSDISTLSKLNVDGSHLWTNEIIGSGWSFIQDLGIDNEGNILVTGYFQGQMIIKSISGTETFNADNNYNSFLIKYSDSGEIVFIKILGMNGSSMSNIRSYKLAISSNNDIYIVGDFEGEIDFDPGDSIDFHLADVNLTFLLCLESDGSYKWVRYWGGSRGYNFASDMAVDLNDSIYITGIVSTPAEFDSGYVLDPLIDTNLYLQPYLCNFTSDGSMQWLDSWRQLDNSHYSQFLTADEYGNIYVLSSFRNNMHVILDDFEHLYNANGMEELYIIQYNANGEFIDINNIDNFISVIPLGIYSNYDNNIYIALKSQTDLNNKLTDTSLILYNLTDNSDIIILNTYAETEIQQVYLSNVGMLYVAGATNSNSLLNINNIEYCIYGSANELSFIVKLNTMQHN